MKRYIVVLLLFIQINANSQVAFYDAIKLKDLGVGKIIPSTSTIQLEDKESVFRILKYYVPVADSILKANIGNDFTGNPFLQFASIPHVGNSFIGDANLFNSI